MLLRKPRQQRMIGGVVQISASTFRNRLSALINQRVDSANNNALVFENADAIAAMTPGVSVVPTVPRSPDTPIINASMRRLLLVCPVLEQWV